MSNASRDCSSCPVGGKFLKSNICSVMSERDGLPTLCVGHWVKLKHQLLEHYVDITRSVRRKFIKSQTTFIDLFCGPGASRIYDEGGKLTQSGVVNAVNNALHGAGKFSVPFTHVYISDIEPTFVEATEKRLNELGNVNVKPFCGRAEEVVDSICEELNPNGFHFTFLDPYNISDLPFDVIKNLVLIKRMDILLHISKVSIQRNLFKWLYAKNMETPLDRFAPGYRDYIDITQANQSIIRKQIFDYWDSLMQEIGFKNNQEVANIGDRGFRTYYWLALYSKHELGGQFWKKIRKTMGQGKLDLEI